MSLPRRRFLQLLGSAAGAATLDGCVSGPPGSRIELAQRGPGLESQAQTVCGLCESACAVTVRLVDGKPVGLKGNPRSPLNRGGLCPVGLAGLEVLYAADRLRGPLRRRSPDADFEDVTWEEALTEISSRLGELHAADGGNRAVFLNGDGGALLHELVERFAHALGSPNFARVDGASHLAYRLTQGIDEVPGWDLSESDLVLSFGLDIYEDGPAPIHAIAAMVGSRPTAERAALIHVGSRLSPSAAKGEEHVRVRPGTHGAFALGIGHVLVREGLYDESFVRERTFGFEDWTDDAGRSRLGFRRLLLEHYYPDRVAQLCGCDPMEVLEVARRFGRADAPVAVVGGEAASGSNATSISIAVHALNALRGVFDQPGGVVLPPPIAITPLESLSAIPAGPALFSPEKGPAGLGVDPFEAVSSAVLDGSHPIEVLVIQGCNPVSTSPIGERLREAVQRIPLVVALAPFRDETASLADFILPTHVPLESWQGFTTPTGVSFSTVALGKPIVEPLGDTRDVGDVLLELGRQIGAPVSDALPWDSYEGYLQHRVQGLALSGQGSVISGSFEESWVHFLEERGWRFLEGSDPETFWEDLTREGGWWNPVHTSGDWPRLFRTPSGRFEFFSRVLETRLEELGSEASGETSISDEEALRQGIAALGLQADGDTACLPHYEPPRIEGEGEGGLTLVLFRPLTARGRLGVVSPMVLEMFGHSVLSGWETWVELAEETAEELDLHDGDRVALQSDRAELEVIVKVQQGAMPGVAYVPLGLGGEVTASSTGERIGANPVQLLLPVPDALSGNLSLTSTRVRLRLVRRREHGGPAPVHEGFS